MTPIKPLVIKNASQEELDLMMNLLLDLVALNFWGALESKVDTEKTRSK